MQHKQVGLLFICNFVIVFVGMGVFPLLPLYATQFGATTTVVGLYLAFIYVAIAAGTTLAGVLAERIGERYVFAGVGAFGLPAIVLLGQATALWQVVLLTAVVWFCGGVGIALVHVFTAFVSDNNSRGRSFSVMALTTPLGAVLGGSVVGYLVASYDYAVMFATIGIPWVVLIVVGLWALPETKSRTSGPAPQSAGDSGDARHAFYLLLLVSLLSAIALNVGRLGTSLSMQALEFTADAVASTTTVSGLVAIPVTLFIGSMSDRLGRKLFLMLAYGIAVAAALMLIWATQLWHFWIAASLILVGTSVSGAVGSAFATDLLPQATLARGLPWLSAMNRYAGIVSFAGAGYLIDATGPTTVYLTSAIIAVVALTLLSLLQPAGGLSLTLRLHHRPEPAC